ncbi:MAG: zinc-ribbon domain-containing protein [Ruminococcaceae bacterium]|nr:zinc-ribbon domain-containing protein [Oscillospiraceae bacterium]
MFCTNCGKEIIDTAKFCNFCGMPVKNMAASVPVTPIDPVQSVQPAQPVPQPEQTAPDYTESAGIPMTESIPETPESTEIPPVDNAPEYESESVPEIVEPAVEASTADDSTIPTPNNIPTYGGSTPVYSAPPAYPTTPVNTVPITQEIKAETAPETKPERRYTLGHIMMCLAAVAVMAIVAGVFAGLYFSVV